MESRLRQYARGLWRQSQRAFERAEVLRVLVLGLVALGAAFLAASFGVGLNAPHLAEWVIGLFALFLFIFVAPFQLWLVERMKVEQLEDERRPHLLMEFDRTNAACIGDTRLRDAYGPDAKYFRVRVTTSGNATVKACRGFMVSIERRVSGGQWRSTSIKDGHDLQWMHAQDFGPTELRPHTTAYLDVFRVDAASGQVTPLIRHSSYATVDETFIPGAYRFNLIVSEENGSAVGGVLEFKMGSKWDSFEVHFHPKSAK